VETYILTINGGSSSIKFALYLNDGSFSRSLHGKIERIGLSGTTLAYTDTSGKEEVVLRPRRESADSEIPNVDFESAIIVSLRLGIGSCMGWGKGVMRLSLAS